MSVEAIKIEQSLHVIMKETAFLILNKSPSLRAQRVMLTGLVSNLGPSLLPCRIILPTSMQGKTSNKSNK